MNGPEQDFDHPILFDAAAAEQAEVPQRIRARALITVARRRLEPIDAGRRFFDVARREIHFHRDGAHA